MDQGCNGFNDCHNSLNILTEMQRIWFCKEGNTLMELNYIQ